MNNISLDNLNNIKNLLDSDSDIKAAVEYKRALYSAQKSRELQELYGKVAEERRELKKKLSNVDENYRKNSDNSTKSIVQVHAESRLKEIDDELTSIRKKKDEKNALLEQYKESDISENDVNLFKQKNNELEALAQQFPELANIYFNEIKQNQATIDFIQNNSISNLEEEIANLTEREEQIKKERKEVDETVKSFSLDYDREQLTKDITRSHEISDSLEKVEEELKFYLQPVDINDLIALYKNEIDVETIIYNYGLQSDLSKEQVLDMLYTDLTEQIKIVEQDDLNEIRKRKINGLEVEKALLERKLGPNRDNSENYLLTVKDINDKIKELNEEIGYYKVLIKNVSTQEEVNDCFEKMDELNGNLQRYLFLLEKINQGKKIVNGFAREADNKKLVAIEEELKILRNQKIINIDDIKTYNNNAYSNVEPTDDKNSDMEPVAINDEIRFTPIEPLSNQQSQSAFSETSTAIMGANPDDNISENGVQDQEFSQEDNVSSEIPSYTVPVIDKNAAVYLGEENKAQGVRQSTTNDESDEEIAKLYASASFDSKNATETEYERRESDKFFNNLPLFKNRKSKRGQEGISSELSSDDAKNIYDNVVEAIEETKDNQSSDKSTANLSGSAYDDLEYAPRSYTRFNKHERSISNVSEAENSGAIPLPGKVASDVTENVLIDNFDDVFDVFNIGNEAVASNKNVVISNSSLSDIVENWVDESLNEEMAASNEDEADNIVGSKLDPELAKDFNKFFAQIDPAAAATLDNYFNSNQNDNKNSTSTQTSNSNEEKKSEVDTAVLSQEMPGTGGETPDMTTSDYGVDVEVAKQAAQMANSDVEAARQVAQSANTASEAESFTQENIKSKEKLSTSFMAWFDRVASKFRKSEGEKGHAK